jgi:hypothetical protein
MAMYVNMFPLFPLMNFTAGASLAVFTFKKNKYTTWKTSNEYSSITKPFPIQASQFKNMKFTYLTEQQHPGQNWEQCQGDAQHHQTLEQSNCQ